MIPARDEAATIGVAIASLAGQDYPGPFHIFLVDDHSSDGTAEAARAAAGPDRLTVLVAPPLPPGWSGKLWALARGVAEATPRNPAYLLFTDADIVHAPGSLSRLVAHALAGGFHLVSLMVRLHCRSFVEKALIPAFVFFFFLLYPPAWTADPRKRTAGAAGGCLLIRRDALERMGGIAAIRGEWIDDCALAARVKQRGGRLWLGLGADTYSLRAYAGFAAIGSMISRTAFTQLRYSPWLLAGTVAGMLVTYVLPPLAVATAAGAAAWLLMMLAYTPTLRYYGRSLLWAPCLPLVSLFYTAATLHSAVEHRRGRGGAWKGRVRGSTA
ncbi:MAG TPA: glycosyltransferase [Bryobacteraceae bacterium]|nr:glycosyltransferase [Bryobacteraceae bacterium]